MSCVTAVKQCENSITEVKKIDHVDALERIVELYLDDVKNREDRQIVIRRLKRYCKMKDLAGLNNMFLNAHSEEVKKLYIEFQNLDGLEKIHLLQEFDTAINYLIAGYSEEV